MRIAVLSDIHGNLPALEALLAEEKARGVRGNHDSAAVGKLDTDSFNDDARAALAWTAREISPTTRAWLGGLPERLEISDFTLVHGSPRDPTWEYVYSVSIARANMSRFTTRHCLVGHTHVPLVYHQNGTRVEPAQPDDGATLDLDEQRTILNPGSVGQPRDGDPRACAMLLDTEQMSLEWRRIEYPVEPVQKLMAKAGLPERLISRLRYGL